MRLRSQSSDLFSLHDDDRVFDVDGDGLSDMDTDPTDASDAVPDPDLNVCSPGGSIYGECSASEDGESDNDEDQLLDTDTDPSDAPDAELDADDASPGAGNDLPPEFFLQMQEDSDDEDANKTLYADSTTKQLDGIERRWNTYCEYTKQDPKRCLRNLSFGKARAFFTWVVTQKTGVGGRRLPGLKSARSLNQYWKEFRLVYERETGKKIDSQFKRKMWKVIRTLAIKHDLTSQPRENRCMTIEDLEKQAKTTISTTKKTFRIGEHRIYSLLYLLFILPSGSRPQALLFLRYGDLNIYLVRDPEGGPHRTLIGFKLHFTKTFLGEKETNTLTLPEIIFDATLLLSANNILLGLIFHHKAFEAPSLTSPEYLDKLDIHPGELELLLPLKESMDETFIFRDTIKTALEGYVLSKNTPITYQMIAAWTKKMSELAGFEGFILYTLRYNSANEFDSSRTCSDRLPRKEIDKLIVVAASISDGLRNLLLQHVSSTTFRKHYLGRVVAVDTMAVVRHRKQQKALMRQACSLGHSVSTRRPTELTAEQSAAVDNDPQIQELLIRRQRFRAAKGSPKVREKLDTITKELQNLRAKLRREHKQKYRREWSRKQAIVDIEKQLAGQKFEQPPVSPSSSNEDAHPAQKRLLDALTAPMADTIEGERRRRNNAILAVMAYCSVQEPPSRRTKKTTRSNKPRAPPKPETTTGGEPETNDAIAFLVIDPAVEEGCDTWLLEKRR
ncbi:hypothetical protein LRP88_09329 [Fusarium phalaenopsidis]